MTVGDGLALSAGLRAIRRSLEALRGSDGPGREAAGGALAEFRFWHLDYGTVPYYDQPVFKRHRQSPAPGRADDLEGGSHRP